MDFRAKVLQGGMYLSLRNTLGVFMQFAGTLVLTRIIGPENYGLYSAVAWIILFVQITGQFGVGVFLVRQQETINRKSFDSAFTFLLILSAASTLLVLGCIPFLNQWIGIEGFAPVAFVLCLTLPLSIISEVPLAKLERDLSFKSIAIIELIKSSSYYLFALAVAFAGTGVWAPVIGTWAGQIAASVMLFVKARYMPRFLWDTASFKALFKFGLGYSTSIWTAQMRLLVNPLIVAPLAGATVVGYIALATRLVNALLFIHKAINRISISAFSKIQDDKPRMLKALSEGMELQIVANGAILVCFCIVAPPFISALLGEKWIALISIVPFLAFYSLYTVLFSLHHSILYVFKKNWQVACVNFLDSAIFILAAWLLVSRLGLMGYGYALFTVIPVAVLIHIFVITFVGKPTYKRAFIWYICFAIPLFSYQISFWLLTILIIPFLWPPTRRQISELRKTIFLHLFSSDDKIQDHIILDD